MISSTISSCKLKDNVSLQKDEPVVVSGWKGRSVEILTKTALVCGSVLAGSVFATASAIYSKIISGMIMLGFAALAVARWVSSPLVNRVSVPENANQKIEAQSIPLDHRVDEVDNISVPPAVELAWYKDGKQVAGAAMGAMALAGLSVLAYYQLAGQEPKPPIDPVDPWGPLRAEAEKNFVKYLPINNSLFNRVNAKTYLHPAISEYFSNAFWLNSPPQKTETLLLAAEEPMELPKQYKLCQGRDLGTGRLTKCKSVKNPGEVVLRGDQRLCEVSFSARGDGSRTWRPLSCKAAAVDVQKFLDETSRLLEEEESNIPEAQKDSRDSSIRVDNLFNFSNHLQLSNSDIDNPILQERLTDLLMKRNFTNNLFVNNTLYSSEKCYIANPGEVVLPEDQHPSEEVNSEGFLESISLFLEVEVDSQRQLKDDLDDSSVRADSIMDSERLLKG